MNTVPNRILMPLGLVAGLMLATGHMGGALALAVAAGVCAWIVRSDGLEHDLHRSHEA